MTALQTLSIRSAESPAINSIAHATHPEEHQILVSVARMMGIDYVFLCCDESNPTDQEIMRLAFQLCEELDLAGDNTMFMLTELNYDALEDTFAQCQIRWVDDFPIELTRGDVTSESQIEYLQTILGHSSNYCSYML
ncbi:MAG: hypothetical protein CL693_09550 [Cellvibrionaceae bacterium]|nr:hypothetical protein [Cellvibrionaceae bacterium]|tara:strand:- start:5719 stop:6129 length:411 start_codon:yes stop_codon:yes gene_type:complete